MKMEKWMICVLVSVAGVIGFVFGAQDRLFTAQEAGFAIEIDGEKQEFEQPALLVDQRTYVPARELCERIGVEVSWDNDAKKVKIVTTARWKNGDPWAAEGILDSGRKYMFDGRDSGFSFEEVKKKSSTMYPMEGVNRNYEGGVPTVRMAAEITEKELSKTSLLKDIKAEDAYIHVYFDKALDCWYAYRVYIGPGYYIGGMDWIEINRTTGQVLGYFCREG